LWVCEKGDVMNKQVPEETFSSDEFQSWLRERKKQDPLDPQIIPRTESSTDGQQNVHG
jgi:hypothetical protein